VTELPAGTVWAFRWEPEPLAAVSMETWVAVPATTVSTPELSVRVPSTAWIWAEPTT
jgi:hypothetical protein